MDVSATTLFVQLWLLDTSAKKVAEKDLRIRKVWNNLDGTRGQQYTRSFNVPGFQDRIFEVWQTWDRMVGEDGRETFIIANFSIGGVQGDAPQSGGGGVEHGEGDEQRCVHCEGDCEGDWEGEKVQVDEGVAGEQCCSYFVWVRVLVILVASLLV